MKVNFNRPVRDLLVSYNIIPIWQARRLYPRCQASGLDRHLTFLGLLIDIAFNVFLGQSRADRADEIARHPDLASPIVVL